MSQLTNELVTLRRQHNQLLAEKEKKEKETSERIESLEKSLLEVLQYLIHTCTFRFLKGKKI